MLNRLRYTPCETLEAGTYVSQVVIEGKTNRKFGVKASVIVFNERRRSMQTHEIMNVGDLFQQFLRDRLK